MNRWVAGRDRIHGLADLELLPSRNTPEEHALARDYIRDHAKDADDEALLLDALELT